jgi:hypothetical protein
LTSSPRLGLGQRRMAEQIKRGDVGLDLGRALQRLSYELFSGDEKSRKESVRLLTNFTRFNKNTLDGVPGDVVLNWCSVDPGVRYRSRRHA